MSSKVKCTCGWSWNKSDSSKKDMYICHECGRDNSNNMKNGGNIPQAQVGKKIKIKNEKGEVETINTASPEYEEIYKAGNIQSPGAGEGDNPYFGGELPEVVVQQQMTPLLQAKKDYEQLSNEEAFTNRKKDEYIKSLGSSNWFGADRNNFPESVLRDINAEYEYNKNTKAIEDVAKKKGFDLNTRGNWIYDLTPSEKEALVNSRYSAQLNPNEFAEMASGVQQLANTMTIGKPWDFDIPGLTQRELEEDRESSFSGLKTFAPLNMPGNAIANYLKNSSDYVENPYGGVQRMGNVDVWDSMAMNPLNLSMITGASKLLAGVPGAVRSIPNVVKTAKSSFSKAVPIEENIFSKYLTQEEAVAARAERLISQKNKPGWNEQLTPDLEQRLANAVENHNPASEYQQ